MKKVIMALTVVLVVLLAATSYAVPNMRFTENFETGWANGTDGTLGNLGDTGALTNGWIITALPNTGATFVGPYPHKWGTAVGDATNHVLALNPMNLSYHHIGGKAHGVDVNYVSTHAVEMSFRVEMGDAYRYGSKVDVWLATQYQFGYGVSIATTLNKPGLRVLNIIKFVPNSVDKLETIPFGTAPAFFDNAGQGLSRTDVDIPNPYSYAAQQPDYLTTYGYKIGAPDERFVTIHLRIEQTAAGQPVKLTAWHTYGVQALDSSYASPDMQFTDDGNGAGGRFPDLLAAEPNSTLYPKAAQVIDLDTLQYVACESSGYTQSDGDPSSYIHLDAIDVYNYAPDTTPRIGDITRDGGVDFKDMAAFTQQWLFTPDQTTLSFVEDFEGSGWVNGADGTLAGDNAQRNGYVFSPGLHYWGKVAGWGWAIINDGGSKVISDNGPIASYRWGNNSAGKPHGLDVSNATSIELSFRSKFNALGAWNQLAVWLADENQNGYGIVRQDSTTDPCGTRPSSSLAKSSDAIYPFGKAQIDAGGPTFNGSAFGPAYGNTWQATVVKSDSSEYIGWVTSHLKLEQSGPGQPVTLTMWSTGSNIPDTSYASPLQIVIDDGTGPNYFIGAPIDLSKLKYIAFSAVWYTAPDLIDDIHVTTPALSTVYGPLDFKKVGRVEFKNFVIVANDWLWQIPAAMK